MFVAILLIGAVAIPMLWVLLRPQPTTYGEPYELPVARVPDSPSRPRLPTEAEAESMRAAMHDDRRARANAEADALGGLLELPSTRLNRLEDEVDALKDELERARRR